MKNQTKQQEAIGRAMALVQEAHALVRCVEYTQKQLGSDIIGEQAWNTENNLDKCYGQLSRLFAMLAEKPLVKT